MISYKKDHISISYAIGTQFIGRIKEEKVICANLETYDGFRKEQNPTSNTYLSVEGIVNAIFRRNAPTLLSKTITHTHTHA